MTNFTNQDIADLFQLSVKTSNYQLNNKLKEELLGRGFKMEFKEKERVKNQRGVKYEYVLEKIEK
jgi:hypothetical protein